MIIFPGQLIRMVVRSPGPFGGRFSAAKEPLNRHYEQLWPSLKRPLVFERTSIWVQEVFLPFFFKLT